jgi:hypothetical protein
MFIRTREEVLVKLMRILCALTLWPLYLIVSLNGQACEVPWHLHWHYSQFMTCLRVMVKQLSQQLQQL